MSWKFITCYWMGIMEIFKIQLPISSNEINPPALIYNESRSIELYIRVNQVKDLFYGSQKKIYVFGEMENNELEFHRIAPEQDW